MKRNSVRWYVVVASSSLLAGSVLGIGCSDVGDGDKSNTEGLPETAPTPMIHPGAKKPAVPPTVTLPADNKAAN